MRMMYVRIAPAVAGTSADPTHFKDLRYQPHHRNARPGLLAALA